MWPLWRVQVGLRFIPARAGNTILTRPRSWISKRFIPARGNTGGSGGSSPRGRGTLEAFGEGRPAFARDRFIPARAGNTRLLARTSTPECTVHPRAGGEHRDPTRRPGPGFPPVHPRAGGEHLTLVPASIQTRMSYGSSPRGRGTRDTAHPDVQSRGPHRFIPARAGNTLRPACRTTGRNPGSSPRGRGTRFSASSSAS